MPPPLLETPRLILRAHEPADAPALAALCNDLDVVRWTSSHPFPYELKHAEEWIANREPEYQAQTASVHGAFLKETGELIGGVGYHNRAPGHQRAELGYLIGKRYWGRGYATEMARCAVRHGFEDLKFTRIYAGVLSGNAASVRVLEKLGLRREGLQRRHINRFGTWHDLELFGLLREEWNGR